MLPPGPTVDGRPEPARRHDLRPQRRRLRRLRQPLRATHVTLTTPESPDTTPPPAPANLTPVGSTRTRCSSAGAARSTRSPTRSGWTARSAARSSATGATPGCCSPAASVRHLAPGSTHTFTVRTRDEAGNLSAPSNAVTVTLPAEHRHDAAGRADRPVGDTAPNCAFADFTSGAASQDVEIYEDGHLPRRVARRGDDDLFGRHAYTCARSTRPGNTSAGQQRRASSTTATAARATPAAISCSQISRLIDDRDAELLGLVGLGRADVGAADQHVGVGADR